MHTAFTSFLKLFHDIPAADEPVIDAATQARSYKEGDFLFKEGRVCRELFFVCSGVLRIAAMNDAGNEVTYYFLKEHQLCSILNSFNNKVVAHESIIAACEVSVLVITRQALDELFVKLPYLEPLIMQITRQALLDKMEISKAYLGHNATDRYRLFMLRQPEVALRVSQAHIASYLGITPQSLSRIRKGIK